MKEILLKLADVLRERLALIANDTSRQDPEKHMERLRIISEEIELLERQLPATIDPQLRHYLQRRSYNKALEQIEALAL